MEIADSSNLINSLNFLSSKTDIQCAFDPNKDKHFKNRITNFAKKQFKGMHEINPNRDSSVKRKRLTNLKNQIKVSAQPLIEMTELYGIQRKNSQ